MSQLQPIDGAYYTSAYFAITTFIALIVAFVGAYFPKDKKS